MDRTAVRSRRVSSTQAFMARMSRRSEISTGDGLTLGGGTSCLGGAGLATHCLVLGFLVGNFLGAADTFGAGFWVLDFLLMLVTGAFLGASVTSVGVSLEEGEGWVLEHDPHRARGSTHPRGSAAQLTVGVVWAPCDLPRRVHRL
jgi:hypothetical protein